MDLVNIATSQPTHPYRDATNLRSAKSNSTLFQSTHPIRDATEFAGILWDHLVISIHAPRVGMRPVLTARKALEGEFQSTHPV